MDYWIMTNPALPSFLYKVGGAVQRNLNEKFSHSAFIFIKYILCIGVCLLEASTFPWKWFKRIYFLCQISLFSPFLKSSTHSFYIFTLKHLWRRNKSGFQKQELLRLFFLLCSLLEQRLFASRTDNTPKRRHNNSCKMYLKGETSAQRVYIQNKYKLNIPARQHTQIPPCSFGTRPQQTSISLCAFAACARGQNFVPAMFPYFSLGEFFLSWQKGFARKQASDGSMRAPGQREKFALIRRAIGSSWCVASLRSPSSSPFKARVCAAPFPDPFPGGATLLFLISYLRCRAALESDAAAAETKALCPRRRRSAIWMNECESIIIRTDRDHLRATHSPARQPPRRSTPVRHRPHPAPPHALKITAHTRVDRPSQSPRLFSADDDVAKNCWVFYWQIFPSWNWCLRILWRYDKIAIVIWCTKLIFSLHF